MSSEQSNAMDESLTSPNCSEVEMARLEVGRASLALLESNQSVSPIQLMEEPKRRRLLSQRLSAGGNSLLKKALRHQQQPTGRRDPLLSSTMVEATHGDYSDWPNTSSIHLNSRDSLGLPQRDLSHLLRTEEVTSSLGFGQLSTHSQSKLASVTDNEEESALNYCCIEAGVTSPLAQSLTRSSPSCGAAPRKNFLKAEDNKENKIDDEDKAYRRLSVKGRDQDDSVASSGSSDKQPSLTLMQVSRLVVQILLEGDLLRDQARRWLTPELLCDKICSSLNTRPIQSDSGDANTSTSLSDDESLDNADKVRHWLVDVADASGRRPVTHSV